MLLDSTLKLLRYWYFFARQKSTNPSATLRCSGGGPWFDALRCSPQAKALEVYAAKAALRHTWPVEAADSEWLTPEQTEIMWENLEERG